MAISTGLQNILYYYILFAATVIIFHGFLGRTSRHFAENLGGACKFMAIGLVALYGLNHEMFYSMPAPMQIYAGVEGMTPGRAEDGCPLTVRDGRNWLSARYAGQPIRHRRMKERATGPGPDAPVMVELKDVWFRYERQLPDVIRDLSLTAETGQTVAIVGPTGAGKTTLVNLILRFYEIDAGSITQIGRAHV